MYVSSVFYKSLIFLRAVWRVHHIYEYKEKLTFDVSELKKKLLPGNAQKWSHKLQLQLLSKQRSDFRTLTCFNF